MTTTTAPNPIDQHVDEDAAAEMLGLNVRTLQRWRCERRVLPFVRIGKCVRYSVADLQQYLADNKVEVTK